MRILKAGAVYFALVFGAGFVLGTIRVLWIVPRLGVRIAELAESPVMLVVSFLAARWVVRHLARHGAALAPLERLGVGLLALGFLVAAELAVVFWLRQLTLADYLASRDPVSGTVYVVSLAAFAAMPLFVARKREPF
ncbi:MAG TPA: hypothetical protein VJV74_16190 [Terriglobia bacterium]|nr:hypothetical protein [Terriglobia bacterium]